MQFLRRPYFMAFVIFNLDKRLCLALYGLIQMGFYLFTRTVCFYCFDLSTVLLSNPLAVKKIWGLFLFILSVFFFFEMQRQQYYREGGQQGLLDH